MARTNSWENVQRGTIDRSRDSSRLGWWAAVAMFLSLLLHVVVFFALDRIQIALGMEEPRSLETAPVVVREVEQTSQDFQSLPPPEEAKSPPPDMTSIMEDVDILQALPKDQELEMRPDIDQEQFAIEMADPVAASGSPDATSIDISAGLDLDSSLPELGRMEDTLTPAAIGQVTIDPGSIQADDLQLSGYTDDLLKKGAEGKVEKGTLDGVASLDDLLGLPANELIGKKTMLPSDLLFEFNSSELRESAKIGLMKLGASLINTARGDLVDQEALIAALESGHLSGAGLDVYPDEPNVDRRLIRHPNVMTLPHIGSATREGREESGMKVIANIRMWADGHRPPDQVLTGLD